MKKTLILGTILLSVSLLTACGGEDGGTPTHTHKYNDSVFAPTCTENGYTLHKCAECEYEYTDTVTAALGHSYEVHKEDTACNQFQNNVSVCKFCKHSYSTPLSEKGTLHSYASVVTYPTREKGGYTTHTCKNCKNSYVDSHTEPVNFSVGLSYKRIDGKYYVSGIGSCVETEITIPAVSEHGYNIAGISGGAFRGSNVTSITIENGVYDIQTGAFGGCTELVSVVLPESAVPGEDIFSETPKLASLTMRFEKPLAYYFDYSSAEKEGYLNLSQGDGSYSGTFYGSIPLSLSKITANGDVCDNAFRKCTSITRLHINEGATYVGKYACEGCTALSQIYLPDSVINIGSRAFASTAISEFALPAHITLTNQTQGIFENCINLSSIALPAAVSEIPASMFLGCTSLSEVTFEGNITRIYSSAFSGTALENFNVPATVTHIGAWAFGGCTKLASITLPEGLLTIDYDAFNGCTALKNIVLPQTLKALPSRLFYGCTSLLQVTLPNGIDRIKEGTFKNCTMLQSITLPVGVTVIEAEAFFGCTSLSELTLPKELETVEGSAFEGCGLVSVSLPGSIKSFGVLAFANCTKLQSVTFESDGLPLGQEMFAGCTALQSLVLPKNTQNIPFGFCKNATGLKNITFPTGLISVSSEAFLGCTALSELTFPQSLIGIYEKAFKGCTALTMVDFQGAELKNSQSLGKEAFAACTALQSVKNSEHIGEFDKTVFENTLVMRVGNGLYIALGRLIDADTQAISGIVKLPDDIVIINSYALDGCKNVTEFILPDSVKTLGTRIFGESASASLKKIVFPAGLTQLSADTFTFLPAVEELVLGKELETIDGNYYGNTLCKITFLGTSAEFYATDWCEKDYIKKCTVFCSDTVISPSEA